MDLKTQRNVLAGVVVVLVIVIGVLLGGGADALTGAAGGKKAAGTIPGNAKGIGLNDEGDLIVTDEDNLANDPLETGQSVVGPDVWMPGLEIHTSGGNDVVFVNENQLPVAFGAPNGTNSVVNGCSFPGGGFVDIGDPAQDYTRKSAHNDFVFTFTDGPVSNFAIGMVDWGDYLPFGACEGDTCAMTMIAYDAAGEVVDSDTTSFTTSDKGANHRNTDLGDTWTIGDACTAQAQQPGHYTFHVSGSGIVRVELHPLDPASQDPNMALWAGPLEFQPDETGFVTGGGFITFDDGTTANYGFNARTWPNDRGTEGELEYNWNEGDMNFHAHLVDQLTCSSADGTATWSGSGATINGEGDYSYEVNITDGKWTGAQGGGGGDLFSIRIWDTATGDVIHEAGPLEPGDTTGQGGGAIVLHKCASS